MTLSSRRQPWAMLIIALALLAALGWGWQRLSSSRESAGRAAQELAECERLAARIEQLSNRPARVAGQEMATTELARLIEQSAAKCGMSADAVIRISPEAARRVEGTSYKEELTEVVLHSVTLQQIVAARPPLRAPPASPVFA